MIELYSGDALKIMDYLISIGIKVDAIITDPPYGTTACSWDTIIPFDLMWDRLNQLIKPTGAIVLFGSEPFSSHLRLSNIDNYKYDWIWNKKQAVGFLNAWKQPLRKTENISVFYKNQSKYNPQIVNKDKKKIRKGGRSLSGNVLTDSYGKFKNDINYRTLLDNKAMPTNIIEISRVNSPNEKVPHPTQKPVILYLIKTYTNETELVLDFTMGSGTTGVACKLNNRNFIGIELDKTYFDIAKKRINETVIPITKQQVKLFNF